MEPITNSDGGPQTTKQNMPLKHHWNHNHNIRNNKSAQLVSQKRCSVVTVMVLVEILSIYKPRNVTTASFEKIVRKILPKTQTSIELPLVVWAKFKFNPCDVSRYLF